MLSREELIRVIDEPDFAGFEQIGMCEDGESFMWFYSGRIARGDKYNNWQYYPWAVYYGRDIPGKSWRYPHGDSTTLADRDCLISICKGTRPENLRPIWLSK